MDPNRELLISVVIPVKNGDQWLESLLEGLIRQTLFSQSEIIVIDSGSTDGTAGILARYPVRVIQIPSSEFNHGDTRNLGAREARGKYVVMTVQDARPASDDWLQSFIDGFTDDTVAGVCGQQVVPHEADKNPVLWYRPISAPGNRSYRFERPEAFFALSPAEQRAAGGWDNVNAAYRRDLLLQYPFRKIDFAEDLMWAKDMLLRGYRLTYMDAATTYHYHHHYPAFVLPRYYAVYYYEYKIYGVRPALGVSAMLRQLLISARILVKEGRISWPAKVKWMLFNWRYWMAVSKTIKRFNSALEGGEERLDSDYRDACKKPPQALKY